MFYFVLQVVPATGCMNNNKDSDIIQKAEKSQGQPSKEKPKSRGENKTDPPKKAFAVRPYEKVGLTLLLNFIYNILFQVLH